MKSAFVMDSVSRLAGGLLEANRRLAQSLEKRGDQILILGGRDAFTEDDRPTWGQVPVKTFDCYGPRRLGYAPGMSAQLTGYDPEVIHSQGMWTYTSWVADRWRKRTGKPEVIHPHGMLDPWALKNSAWKKRLMARIFERRHLSETSCLRALCHAELEAIRSYGLRNPICVIPNGIDLPAESLIQRAQDKVLPNKKVLLYLGRLHPKKGLVNLLHAWASISKQEGKTSEWVLAIAGWDEGGHEDELKKLASDLGITWCEGLDLHAEDAATVRFLGPKFGREKEQLYRDCDSFILPSFSEGLPMVILEAWAFAKPVIITPMCHLPEGLTAQAAFEVSPEVGQIQGGLNRMIQLSDAEREEMGARGRTLVGQRFTWDLVGSQMQSVQDWLVKDTPAPECVFF